MEQSSVPTAQSVQVGLQRYVLLTVMLGTGTVSLNNSSFNPAIPHAIFSNWRDLGELGRCCFFIGNEHQLAARWLFQSMFW